jgi:hypothetical protein
MSSDETDLQPLLDMTDLKKAWEVGLEDMYHPEEIPTISALASAAEFEAECQEHVSRLVKAVKENPLPKDINAFYLGIRLNNTTEEGARVYLGGAEGYSGDPEDEDWASGFEWEPATAEFRSKILAKLEFEPEEEPLREAQILFAILLVAEFVRLADTAALLRKTKAVTFAVGHDDGDLYYVGELTASGFKALPNG